MKKTITILALFALIFTSLPVLGDYEADAASSYIRKLTVSATGQTTTKLVWTKLNSSQKNKITGISIFRNGKLIKNVNKNTYVYKDTKLKAKTRYTYRVYTYTKVRRTQWYNKKTKRWQFKKPAARYCGKYRRVYIKRYKNPSPKRTVTTKAKPTPSVTEYTSDAGDAIVSVITGKNFRVNKDLTFSMNGITIYAGQDWTNALYNQLASVSDGTYSCAAAGYDARDNFYRGKAYMFNTNQYNPFLAVYVLDGQIVTWATNAQTVAICGNTKVVRGMTKAQVKSITTTSSCFPSSGLLVGGGGCGGGANAMTDYTLSSTQNAVVALHFVNAARVAKGVGILKRSKYLEGAELNTGAPLTYTGPIEYVVESHQVETGTFINILGEETILYEWESTMGTKDLANQRYGAQAWAETMMASDDCAHSELPVGPMADVGLGASLHSVTTIVSKNEIGRYIRLSGQNVSTGTGAEMAIFAYSDSPGHIGTILSPNMKSAGFGSCVTNRLMHYSCENYSIDEAE